MRLELFDSRAPEVEREVHAHFRELELVRVLVEDEGMEEPDLAAPRERMNADGIRTEADSGRGGVEPLDR